MSGEHPEPSGPSASAGAQPGGWDAPLTPARRLRRRPEPGPAAAGSGGPAADRPRTGGDLDELHRLLLEVDRRQRSIEAALAEREGPEGGGSVRELLSELAGQVERLVLRTDAAALDEWLGELRTGQERLAAELEQLRTEVRALRRRVGVRAERTEP